MTVSLGQTVHYVSYGSPGGEYHSVCRVATVTSVGAWRTTDSELGEDSETRTLWQTWDPTRCALEVHNPTGLFFNECDRDELPTPNRVARGAQAAHRPGTWHTPTATCEAVSRAHRA